MFDAILEIEIVVTSFERSIFIGMVNLVVRDLLILLSKLGHAHQTCPVINIAINALLQNRYLPINELVLLHAAQIVPPYLLETRPYSKV